MYNQGKLLKFITEKLNSDILITNTLIYTDKLSSKRELFKKLKSKKPIEYQIKGEGIKKLNSVDLYYKKQKKYVKRSIILNLNHIGIINLGKKYKIYDYLNEEII